MVYVGSDDDSVFALKASTGALVWSYKTGDFIESAPAVADGVVYIGSADSYEYALDALSGALLWKSEIGIYTHDTTVVNGVVYVGGYALDARTGTRLWFSFDTDNAPAVVDGVVYETGHRLVEAVDAATGTPIWTYTRADPQDSSPAVVDGAVYITDGRLTALNASNGRVRWQTAGGFQASPSVASGVVYVAMAYGSAALSAKDGSVLWTRTLGDRAFLSPSVANDVVYIGSWNKTFYALDAGNGDILWSHVTGGPVGFSPAVANGYVYVGSLDHDLYAFHLPRNGSPAKGAAH
jgi:outer membrane protein assembly factor BamB